MKINEKPICFQGEYYMKKGMLIVCCALFLPAAALAQEKTLYNIGQDMLVIVETYAACAARDSACTSDDALALQADAENTLSELKMLIRSGSVQRMSIALDQAQILSERASLVRGLLAHIELFDAQCNRSIQLMVLALGIMATLQFYLSYFFGLGLSYGWTPGFFVILIALAIVVLISMVFVLGATLFMGPCLFWWL